MRRNKSIFVLALLLGLINGIGYANAQTTTPSDQTLIYGTSVKGEITSSVASDNYTFVGKANDVVVISMKQDGLDSNLSPLIKVLGAKKTSLGDTSKSFTILSAVLALELPDDGTYTIVASHTKSDKPTTGKFILTLDLAKPLTDGTTIKDKMDNSLTAYYAIHATGSFTVAYQKMNGDFNPEIDVNTFDEGELKSISSLNGMQLSKGSISLTSEPDVTYIVTVGVEKFSFSFNKTTVQYSLAYTVDKN